MGEGRAGFGLFVLASVVVILLVASLVRSVPRKVAHYHRGPYLIPIHRH